MQNKRIYMVLLTVLALLFSLISVQAQDDEDDTADELDTSVLSLRTLDADETIEDSIDEDTPFRVYVILGEEGDEVTIEMVATDEDELDTFLTLLGPAGQSIAFNDDDEEVGGFNSAIRDVELPQTGLYFVVASPLSLVSGGVPPEDELTFELTMTGATGELAEDDEDTDTPAYPFFFSPTSIGETFDGFSNDQEPVYYITFVGSEDQVLDIEMTSDDIDTFVLLVGPDGAGIAYNDDAEDSLNSAIDNAELPEDGIYLVMATTYGFWTVVPDGGYPGGDFELDIIEVEEEE